MPKFLFKGSYSQSGIAGVLKEGGSARVEVARTVAESVGGSVESFHFAFGGSDFFVIADLPDNAAAVAISATIGASGAMAALETVPLLTPSELDDAVKRTANWRPPGA